MLAYSYANRDGIAPADSSRQRAHFGDQIRLAFKANPRQRWQSNEAFLDAHAVREATVRLEQIGV